MFPTDVKIGLITVAYIEYILLQRAQVQINNSYSKFSFGSNDTISIIHITCHNYIFLCVRFEGN